MSIFHRKKRSTADAAEEQMAAQLQSDMPKQQAARVQQAAERNASAEQQSSGEQAQTTEDQNSEDEFVPTREELEEEVAFSALEDSLRLHKQLYGKAVESRQTAFHDYGFGMGINFDRSEKK